MENRNRFAVLRVHLLLCLLLAPATVCAAENCPWLNAATASGLIGATATSTYVAASAGQPAVCTFTEVDSRTPSTLEIRVETTPQAHERLTTLTSSCNGSSPLPAIGNEAVTCTADEGKAKPAERVIGRVRDQVFTITITLNGKTLSPTDRDDLKMRIATAAEQVSGNLF